MNFESSEAIKTTILYLSDFEIQMTVIQFQSAAFRIMKKPVFHESMTAPDRRV